MKYIVIALLLISAGLNLYLLSQESNEIVEYQATNSVVETNAFPAGVSKESVVEEESHCSACDLPEEQLAALVVGGEESDNHSEEEGADKVSEAFAGLSAFADAFTPEKMAAAKEKAKIIENAQTLFDSEEVDPEWAYGYEDKLHQVIAEKDFDEVAPVQDIQCKSTTCRVEVGISETEQVMGGLMQFAGMVVDKPELKKMSISSLRDYDNGTLKIYLTDLEKGKTLYSGTN